MEAFGVMGLHVSLHLLPHDLSFIQASMMLYVQYEAEHWI